MRIFLLIIFMFYVADTKKLRSISNRNNVFQLINKSVGIPLSKFVLLPNFKNINESFEIQYKSFRKSTTIISSSEWILSVYIDQHFFYNNQSNEPLHALCFLQFSIEKSGNEIGKNASCKIILRVNNFTATANCSLKLGMPPSTCSGYFDMTELALSNSSPTWASVSAELTFPKSKVITNSINQPGFLFNNFNPVNWTVVQSDQTFGKFALGLPIVSVKTGSSFKMPFSISEINRLNFVKILIQYNDCFSYNGFENLNNSRWEIQNNFYRTEKEESGFIRISSLPVNFHDDKLQIQKKWQEIGLINFNVIENSSKDRCWIRAGISKVEEKREKIRKYFDKNNFHEIQKSIPVSVDSINMIMIVFPEPQATKVKLYSSLDIVGPVSSHVYTYLLHKSNDLYLPQLIKNLTCHSNKFLNGIPNEECVPMRFSNSWVLPLEIQHWKTVVFNIFNFWRPESWKIFLSDKELNPISDWRVFRNNQCVVLYQSAVLKIGTRLASFNSFGMMTYLGATFDDLKPWIDVSKETDLTLITAEPPGVVNLSRNNKGSILVDVSSNRRAIISLNDRKSLLTDTEISVFTDHWASVMKFVGRCISDFDLNKTESHPIGEGQFSNYELKLKKLNLGEKCRLFIGVVFNDDSQMLLEDLAMDDYRLVVNGIEFKNGNHIHFKLQMNIVLYGSPFCKVAEIVKNGTIDLSKDWSRKGMEHIRSSHSLKPVISDTTANIKNEKSTDSFIEEKNSWSIAIYCIVGIVSMAVIILLLNCVIGFNVRRNSTSHMQRRLSKSGNFDRQNIKTDFSNSQKPPQELYPPLLPPPGPIMPPGKPLVDWTVSSESGIGLERSSLGSQQDPVALSTFRISMANGSMNPSDSSSYIHRTSPFNDLILESNVLYPIESASQQIDSHINNNRSFWPKISTPYRMPNLDGVQDFRSTHDSTISSEHRKKSEIV